MTFAEPVMQSCQRSTYYRYVKSHNGQPTQRSIAAAPLQFTNCIGGLFGGEDDEAEDEDEDGRGRGSYVGPGTTRDLRASVVVVENRVGGNTGGGATFPSAFGGLRMPSEKIETVIEQVEEAGRSAIDAQRKALQAGVMGRKATQAVSTLQASVSSNRNLSGVRATVNSLAGDQKSFAVETERDLEGITRTLVGGGRHLKLMPSARTFVMPNSGTSFVCAGSEYSSLSASLGGSCFGGGEGRAKETR